MAKLKKSIKLIGDRLLVEFQENKTTDSGLIIPDTAKENEETAIGIVVNTGPGFLNPHKESDVDSWMKENVPEAHHVPLQIQKGYKVIYFRKMAAEVKIEGKTYHVLPQSGVLVYDENPFNI